MRPFGLKRGSPRFALIAATVSIWLLLGLLFRLYGYQSTWRLWGIPTMSPFFMDLRQIPAMVEARHLGLDPAVDNPLDPMHRTFNYPRIWYLLSYTNLSQADTLWLGLTLICLFFLGVFLFPGRLHAADVLLMLLVIFSPAAMLLYERANIDLLMFFLCALAVAALTPSLVAAFISMEFALLLKFFPLFGFSVFLARGRRAFLLVLAAAAAVFIVYLVIASRDLNSVWTTTPRGADYAYGSQVLAFHFSPFFQDSLAHSPLVPRALSPLIFAVTLFVELAFALAFIFWSLGIRRVDRLTSSSQRNLDAFWLGSAIYVGTFLLGNNWDYRLAFLLFAVPQLSEWSRDPSIGQRVPARVTLGLLLLSCWYLFYRQLVPSAAHDLAFAIDELANWALCAGLTYFLAASVPDWLRSLLVRRPLRHLQNA